MRVLKFLLQKEFRQIFRNPTILRMILIMPIVQLMVMPLAADYEIKHINLAIVDYDRSSFSKAMIQDIFSTNYFQLVSYGDNYNKAYALMEADKADLILQIPNKFEKNLVRNHTNQLFLAVNAINGVKASIGSNYLSRILTSYNQKIRSKLLGTNASEKPYGIEVVSNNWYNPYMNYKFFMVPGILVVLVTMIAMYMCALNIVKEKEVGTIEQINVTPVSKLYFIIGKLVPFWIIGMIVFSIGLFGVARNVYHIIPMGSYWLIYAFLGVYLIAQLGLGLLMSTYSQNQQQAMSLAFFIMMIFMMMSGLFTPIESMPEWAQMITKINPVSYFIEVMRLVVMKDSGFREFKSQFFSLCAMALVFNGWAVLNYRKTS